MDERADEFIKPILEEIYIDLISEAPEDMLIKDLKEIISTVKSSLYQLYYRVVREMNKT